MLLLLCLPLAAVAQAPSTTNPPVGKPDLSQEAFVMEQYARKVKLDTAGTSTQEDTARVRIQSDAGVQRYGLLAFSYASGTGDFVLDYVRVRKADGTVVVTPPENIQDMAAQITREAPFYSDLREKHVAVKGLGVGDTLEYGTHTTITKPLAPGQFWLDYTFTRDIIVLQEQIEVTVPRDRAIKVRSPDTKPAIRDAGPDRVYTWTSSNLQRKDDKKSKQEQAKHAWEQARGLLPQPDVMISSFQSWEEVGRWYGGLQAERVKPSPEVRAKAAELTKGAADDEAKLRAIYNYVSTQFRYIGIAFGIGRYQPHSAAEVMANQYGDCKDKHTLLASLLEAAGIKVYPALISTVRDIDSEMPSPLEFNHVITVVPRGSGLVWLDTTTEVAPFGYLVPALREKRALAIPDQKSASLLTTPADVPFSALQQFEMKAKLSDSGVLEGKADYVNRGDVEMIFRMAFRSVPLPNWKDLVQTISYAAGFGGDISDVTSGSPEKTDEPFRFSYDYKRKDYSDWSNRRITPPLPVISLPAADDDTKPLTPIWLGSLGEIIFRAAIELPKGYTPRLPKSVHTKTDFADFDTSYSFKDGLFKAERHMVIKRREVPANEFAEYKTFRKSVEDDYTTYTILSSAKTGQRRLAADYQEDIWELSESENPEAARLYDNAREEYQRHNLEGEIESLKRAVEIDPKFVRAWLWLGEIYKFNRLPDLAEEAYHKAIEIDPQQSVSYKALAFSLMNWGRLEDSIPVWHQLMKVAPEDPDGPASLASTLYRLKRFDEAIEAMELAVRLNPDDAHLQWQLASAYLHADQEEKAAATFRKAVDLNPDQELLNDTAYEMAEAGKQLLLALEYAERAVRAEEDASAQIDLEKLRIEDLRHTHTLAAYWDTLGWVHNHASRLEDAEKYLKAAWKISQDGVIASHLCRVEERLHKTQAARQMCEFSQYRIPLATGLVGYKGLGQLEADRKLLERLQALSKSSTPQNIVETANQLSRMTTFKMPRLLPGTASAEFFVLFATDPVKGVFKVQDVKFISGSEKMKLFGKTLNSIVFDFPTPDHTAARFVRRGILGCYQYAGCSFVLLDPATVQSLN